MKIIDTLVRIYVPFETIDNEISFYEELTGEKAMGRFKYEEMKLEIVRVGGFLIIAGNEDALERFRTTSATIRVDDLRKFREFIISNGGKVLEDIKKVPTGENMTAQHKDGTIIEYVQHNKYKVNK